MDFTDHNVYLTVKDHSVSGETFQLLLDKELQLLKTHPQPATHELGRYYESEDYISHTDSKRSLFEKLYHAVRQKALRDKVKLLHKYKPERGRLLDIGAGTGDFLATARKSGWEVEGYEPNDGARAIAGKKGVAFVADIGNVVPGTYDIVTMWHVLEHVPDVEKQIRELKRIIKHDGIVIIAVPNFESYDAQKYGEYWAAYDVPRHLWHFSATAIEKLFGAEAMEVEAVLPMKFDSYYVSLLSEKYKNGKMSFLRGFLNGLQSNISAQKNGAYSSLIYVVRNRKR